MYLYYIFAIILLVSASKQNCESELKPPSENETFELVHQWKYINFTWPSQEKYREAISAELYIPGNSVILGVKYYKEKFYLAMPKIKVGSPVSLAYIMKNSTEETNPLLTPFPDWSTNLNENCSMNLENLQSMEIDEEGLMWIIDGRRVDPTSKKCPPKLLLLDLNQNGRIVHTYILPDDVCSHETCSMNDVVLDDVDGGFAYITDNSFTDPGLIIYSRKQNKAWKVRDSTMYAEENAIHFSVHGILQSKQNNVNGIALAQRKHSNDENRLLYFTALSAFTLYSIDSYVLRNETLATSSDVGKFINAIGNKTAQSAGMIVDSKGELFYGLVAQDAVLKWNTSQDISTVEIVERNPELMSLPDSYTIDDEGYLYLLASNIVRFAAGKTTLEENNFKLLKLYIGACSYIFS